MGRLGYDGKPLAAWVNKAAGITLEIIKRSDAPGFRVVARRWVVERTFGWLLRYRRLVRDYERRTEHHEAMVWWATVLIMTPQAGALPDRPAARRALGAATATAVPIYRLRQPEMLCLQALRPRKR